MKHGEWKAFKLEDYGVKRLDKTTAACWAINDGHAINAGQMAEQVISTYYNAPLQGGNYTQCGDIVVDGMQVSIKLQGATMAADALYSDNNAQSRLAATRYYLGRDVSDYVMYATLDTDKGLLHVVTLSKEFWHELVIYYGDDMYLCDLDAYRLRVRVPRTKIIRYLAQYETTHTLFCGEVRTRRTDRLVR